MNLACISSQLTSLDLSSNLALENLFCTNNQLTSLDVSNNPELLILSCPGNQLTSLDLSQNTALTTLQCANNQITSLDASNNTQLLSLICNDNQLTSLDVRNGNNSNITAGFFSATNNPGLTCIDVDDVAYATTNWTSIDAQTSFSLDCNATVTIPDTNFEQALIDLGIDTNGLTGTLIASDVLGITTLTVSNKNISDLTGIEAFTDLTFLNCNNNSLTSLDVSANTALTVLRCTNNQLTSLDVSANTALTSLRCHFNQLTSLDVSANTALTSLRVHFNQLTSLDVRNGNNTIVTDFIATNNPSLNCINVDNVAYSNANWPNKDAQTVYSTDCATLGLNDIKQAIHLTLYPNPATDVLYIKASQSVQISKVDIFDISGKRITTTSLANKTLNVSQLKSGLYFVTITANDTAVTKKLIIK